MNRRVFKERTTELGDIPFYKTGTHGIEAEAFISKSLFDEDKANYPYPKAGDVLISASGSIQWMIRLIIRLVKKLEL